MTGQIENQEKHDMDQPQLGRLKTYFTAFGNRTRMFDFNYALLSVAFVLFVKQYIIKSCQIQLKFSICR